MTAYYNEIDPYAAQWLRNLIDGGHIARGDVDERSIVDVRADDLAGYAQCHFFAGIGGWSLALRLAGWPDDRPVWTGSCPCQPFSRAGNRDGAADERHLWPRWFNLVSECRPAVIFGEQVTTAIRDHWIDAVAHDLEEKGYAVATAVLPACAVGAPHVRGRLWFVADSGDQGMEGQFGGEHSGEARPWQWRSEEDLRAIASSPFERGGRWPQPLVRRVDDGLSTCVGRLRAYGNAIVPQVAAEFIGASMTHSVVTSQHSAPIENKGE